MPEVVCKKGHLKKKIAKITEEQLCQGLFLKTLQAINQQLF